MDMNLLGAVCIATGHKKPTGKFSKGILATRWKRRHDQLFRHGLLIALKYLQRIANRPLPIARGY
jgi:hypothetical protein